MGVIAWSRLSRFTRAFKQQHRKPSKTTAKALIPAMRARGKFYTAKNGFGQFA